MVNTGQKDVPIAIFRKQISTTNPNDIPVVVNGSQVFTLSAEKGAVPQKICVPATVAWTDERVNIETKYPKFNQWVTTGQAFGE